MHNVCMMNDIRTFAVDVVNEVLFLSHCACFELLSMFSLLFLRMSQVFASVSRALLVQAEKEFTKSLWF